MPRGKWVNHKGRSRRFTSPEELAQEGAEEQKNKWKQKNRDMPPSDSESDDEDGSDSDESEESDDESKGKGVEGLIDIENPNRVQKKNKKLSTLNESDNVQLTRKEKEQIAKQKATLHYQKLHSEGKTDEARADLARLAIIRQQREEAAKKREQEKQEKEVAKQAKSAETSKALNKH